MAIKTVSQLNNFDNNDQKNSLIGGKLHYYQQTHPQKKKSGGGSEIRTEINDNKIISPRASEATQNLVVATDTFYQSLLEISQPENTGSETPENYYSKQITYLQLLKNIIFDVKQYLNERNGLYDTNIEELRYESSTFGGHKKFITGTDYTNGIDIVGDLSVTSSIKIDDANFIANNNGIVIDNNLTSQTITLSSDINTTNPQLSLFFPKINGFMAKDDWWSIGPGATSESNGYLVIATGSNGTEPIYVRQYKKNINNPEFELVNQAILLDKNGNTYFSKINCNELSCKNTLSCNDLCCYESVFCNILDCESIKNVTTSQNIILSSDLNTEASICHQQNNVNTGRIKFGASITNNNIIYLETGIDDEDGGVAIKSYAKTSYRGLSCSNIYVGSGENNWNGTITAGECNLTASHAKWSDLAEYYIGDKKYEPGTLVKFGGKNEITIADNIVNAVITSKPGYIMNSELKNSNFGCAIALVGRVPVKITGKIKKFDKIVLSKNPGIGRSKKWYEFWKKNIGISLEEKMTNNIKLVECLIKLSI